MIRRVAGVAAVVLAFAPGSPAMATADATPNRLAGPDRFQTARVVAEQTFTGGAETVILVSGRAYPDALAASYLSGAAQVPILLTEPGALPQGLTDTIRGLGASGVQVIGGTGAVADAVLEQLRSEGFVVSRLAGADRYETARRVAELLPPETIGDLAEGRTAILATGEDFPDALAAGPASFSQRLPILLTERGALNANSRSALEALAIEQVLIAGGTGAVDDTVVDEIEDLGISVRRVAGGDRTGTALAFAELVEAELHFPMTAVLLARGDRFADALAGGARGGRIAAPIMLTSSDGTLDPATRSFIRERTDTIGRVDALGGVAAVPDATLNDAVAAAQDK